MKTDENEPLILVINDDTEARLEAEAVLKNAGCVVLSATNGEDGIVACNRFRPDLIVLDAVLPGMDGLAVINEIRTHPHGEQIPILMLTGLEDLGFIRKAYEAGVTDFAAKPANWTVIGYRIGRILRLNRAFSNLSRSEEGMRALVRAIPDQIFRLGNDGTVLEVVSESAKSAPGSENRHAKPKLKGFIPEIAAEQALRFAEMARSSKETQRFEFAMDKSGELRRYEARLAALPNDESLFISRDITEQKIFEERLVHMAYHDTLTGLPNRVLLDDCLKREIANAKRRHECVGVVLFDLDRFKEINDTMGHAAGDQLLVLVAERLKNVLRETDTVARFGGDEFCAVLPGQIESSGSVCACRRIEKFFSEPVEINGKQINIAISFGVSTYPNDGETPEILIRKADIAMFRAKAEGGGFRCFTEDMNQEGARRIEVENELRKAIDRNELHVYYQPEVDLHNGKIVGAEALLRWLPPAGKMVSPSEFIPIAEEMGIIGQMSEHVLRTVCFQMKKWRSNGFSPLRVSVNISSRLLNKYDLSSTLSSLIEETGVAAESLDLEIAESAAIQNLDQAMKTVRNLIGLSFRVTMDDFGSSYSSLMCFHKFPLNLLKIDRKFISELEYSFEDQAIVKAIIAMANTLDIKVLAKGVERKEQVKMLKSFGCRLAQGYYFEHPMSSDEFTGLLEKRRATGRPG